MSTTPAKKVKTDHSKVYQLISEADLPGLLDYIHNGGNVSLAFFLCFALFLKAVVPHPNFFVWMQQKQKNKDRSPTTPSVER